MHRDVLRLSGRTFDLLVVGGGIYGLTVACDAAGRGLSVALIERDDFGSGASFNHLRTIHGGLRYLQHLDVRRARESVRERRTLARIAPWAVRPLPFVLPLERSLARGGLAMRAGFLLDRTIAHDRNEGVPDNLRLPAGTVLSAPALRHRFPDFQGVAAGGAAVWYDYVTIEADRLTLAWALAADRNGAALANYVQATALLQDGARVRGVRALDGEGSGEFEIEARVTVNATGPLMRHLGVAGVQPQHSALVKAMNLVTSRSARTHAAGGRSASGRNLFLVPWRGRALFGTWESPGQAPYEDRPGVRLDEIDAFVNEINQAFPAAALRRDEINLVHRGLVPGSASGNGGVALNGHDRIDERTGEYEGLITVEGAKYTTARAVAERVVDRVFRKIGRTAPPCRTGADPLPDAFAELDGDGALIRAVRDEMAVHLSDAVIRRTPLGAVQCPGVDALSRAAEVMGQELGWSPDQKMVEMQAVRDFYAVG